MILWTLFTMGVVHGLNADHLAALSAFTLNQSSRKKALLNAFIFALCHSATLFFITLFVHGFYGSFPFAFEETAHFLSRALLFFLAAILLVDVFQPSLHKHAHSHDAVCNTERHRHYHVHVSVVKSHAHSHFPLALGGALAFSHARLFLSVVVLFQTSSVERFAAPLFFGAGLLSSMIMAGIFFSFLHSSLKKATLFSKAVQVLSALACVVTAAWMV